MNEVTIADVLLAARHGRAPVAPESAGYLVLAVADALTRAPVQVGPTSILLSTEGSVTLRGGEAVDSVDAERTVRALLAELLASSMNPTPALSTAARRRASGGIASLVTEIEGALIPVNRSAAQRALARLARETVRVHGALGQLSSRRPSTRPVSAKPAPPESRPDSKPLTAVVPEATAPLTPAAPKTPAPVQTSPAVEAEMPFIPPLSPPPPAATHELEEHVADHDHWFTPAPPPEALHEPTEPLVFQTTPVPAAAGLVEEIRTEPEPSDAAIVEAAPPPPSEAPEDRTVPLPDSRRLLPPSTPRMMIEPEIYLVPGTTPTPPSIAQLLATMPLPSEDVIFPDPTPSVDVVVGTPIALRVSPISDSEVAPEVALARAVADVAKIALAPTSSPPLAGPVDVPAAPPQTPESPPTQGAPLFLLTAPVPQLATAPAASVETLLEGFSSSVRMDERAVALALKRSVGLDATPPPPSVVHDVLGRDIHPVERETREDAPVDMAPFDLARPPRPRAPKTTQTVLFGFLLIALGTTAAVWALHPGFFTGH